MSTKSNIERLARELYDKVVKEYLANPNILFMDILNRHLREYNQATNDLIKSEIGTIISEVTGVGVAGAGYQIYAAPDLSSLLYKNSQYVSKQAGKVISEHLKTKGTIKELRKKLYEGYGLRPVDEEVLDIVYRLPKYLQGDLTEAQLSKLKTKELKAAYLNVLDAKNDKALKKALESALYEKARYYSGRIAATEEHKAFTLARAFEMKENDVKYVKVSLSAEHKIFCVCDGITGYNGTGYGVGVYKYEDCPLPPYHPWCRCKIAPFTPKRRWEPVSKGDYLSRYSQEQQKTLLAYERGNWKIDTPNSLL